MSLLDVGARCAGCSLVDFLPTKCPHCGEIYCKDHISSHRCSDPQSSLSGPSKVEKKSECGKTGCERPSIEGVTGYTGLQGDIARSVKCPGCHGSFCTLHRSQDAHDCSAPRSYNVLGDAALQRKEKAREVLMKHFPDQPIREIEKPIAHNRDPKRLGQGVLEESPPSAVPTSTPNLDEVKPKTKTKEDKVWEIHVKKVKMSAKPLIPSQKDDGDRRFFELKSGVVDPAEVIKWKDVGKMSGVLEKVWVNGSTPVGKILDVLRERNKVGSSATTLVALYAPPGSSKQVIALDNANAASSIPDGSIVILQ